ncbi:sorting nexin-5-like [Acanthaster planci]|uniref:Sorting nexin-5-like n=1 Tax=Acanthaster planci TaxID=133434 RepID=A0A8B7ZEB9_ACAPL|nr:sorting nexin-5-like [Acanthaster planci]
MEEVTEQNGEATNDAPFEPWYQVQVTGATKNGSTIIFDVVTKKLEEGGQEATVQRVYEDVEWLHHCLMTDTDTSGIIMPPLPVRPLASAADAAAKAKRELGSDATVKGDEFYKHCRSLEKYLQLVIRHNFLGKNESLGKFLTEPEPPVRAKLKNSFLTNLTKVVGEVRKGGHQDLDPSFQKERSTVNEMVKIMTDSSLHFNNMLNVSERFSASLNNLSTALCLASTAAEEGPVSDLNKLQLHFAKAVEHYSHGIDIFVANDEQTLGFCLDHYAKYLDSEKSMLFIRTCKLLEYENASKSLEKAKPLKKEAAEELKEKREKEFNAISEIARKEITKFHRQRVVEFQKALILYAEAKIKTARDISALLAKDLSTLKQMELSDGSGQ